MKTILITIYLFFLFGMSYGQKTKIDTTVASVFMVDSAGYLKRVAVLKVWERDINYETHFFGPYWQYSQTWYLEIKTKKVIDNKNIYYLMQQP